MAPSSQVHLDVHHLWNDNVSQKFNRKLAEKFGEPKDSNSFENLWIDSTTKSPRMLQICLRGALRASKGVRNKILNIERNRRESLKFKTGVLS